MKVQKAGLGLLMLMNQMKKEGKKRGREQARIGEMENRMKMANTRATTGLTDKETTGMNVGGMPMPTGTGSYIKQSIDGFSEGDFVNASTQEYYKDLL